MTENAKTITFLTIGLLAIAIALVTQPTSAVLDVETLLGEELTDKFTAPEEAKRLRIVRFDEATAVLREFEVAEQDGLWSIPSKDGYPADAERQMAEAATSLMDRKILAIMGDNAGEHEQFGVVDPTSPSLEVGQKGVGARVTMYDAKDSPLVDLIIGGPVKDAENQRYVRRTNQDMVYVIEIDPAKLSTNFEDWIEKDLLKINAWDLQQVEIKDYAAEMMAVMTPDGGRALQVGLDPRAELTLGYDDEKTEWTPVKLREFKESDYVDFTLAEDQQLNTEKLDALKTALDDLAIVDVVRKPSGLSDDLKAGADFLENQEARLDLLTRGFAAAAAMPGGPEEIISSDGELIATLKDGTEYVLRFGNLTNISDSGQPADANPSEGGQPPAQSDVHRYMFVMARFNEEAVPKPELQEAAADDPAQEAERADESTSETEDEAVGAEEPAETGPADDAAETTEAAATDAESTDAAAADAESAAGALDSTSDGAPASDATNIATNDEAAAEEAADDDTSADSAVADSSGAADDVAAVDGDASPDAEAAATTDDADEAPADEGEASDAAAGAEQAASVAANQQIEQENQRKMDEYEQVLEKGRENVRQLNERFGDWYFVVANDVFNKIRLSRDDVIQAKDAASAEGSGAEQPGQSVNPFGQPGGMIPGLQEIPGAGSQTE